MRRLLHEYYERVIASIALLFKAFFLLNVPA
jgi:hypothetical protein